MTKIEGYNRHQFVRNPVAIYEHDLETDERVYAYIALPMNTTTIREESDILWWGKVHSEPEMWEDDEMYYRVYEVYLKPRNLLEMSDELRKIGGFYLRRNMED
jgi:hypothetical protein